MTKAYTHSWDDLRFSLFSPLSYFCIYLVAELWFDLAGVSSKKGEEALCPAVDDVYLMQGDGVHNFLALLNFALRALYELGL